MHTYCTHSLISHAMMMTHNVVIRSTSGIRFVRLQNKKKTINIRWRRNQIWRTLESTRNANKKKTNERNKNTNVQKKRRNAQNKKKRWLGNQIWRSLKRKSICQPQKSHRSANLDAGSLSDEHKIRVDGRRGDGVVEGVEMHWSSPRGKLGQGVSKRGSN